MILKNEAHHLSACLNSVQSLTPELLLVDTGSSDNTAQIAAAYGATLIPFDFATVNFAAARNHALEQANGRWILVLDADETLDSAALPLLKSLLATNLNAGYFLERLNHSADPSASLTDHVVRLFPNHPAHRYHGRVHETIDNSILATGGKLLESPIRIHHNFASNPAARCAKNHWYIQILQEEVTAHPEDLSRLDFLAAEYHQLGMFEEACRVIENIARLRPLDAQAHLFAGTYHLLFQPDFTQAFLDLQQALLLQPDYPEAKSFLRLLAEKQAKSSTILSSNTLSLLGGL